MKTFEIVPHTADLKIRVFGSTIGALFANAVVAMFQAIKPEASGCTYKGDLLICSALPQKHELTIQAPDRASLLVNFLSEALYLSDTYNEAYLRAEIDEISDSQLKATLFGVTITGFEVVEIKAVTYHDLVVEERDGMWVAEIVFDI